MDAQAARSLMDVTLFEDLLKEPPVQAARDLLTEQSAGTRRALLARALRLTPEVAPDAHRLLSHCTLRLGVLAEVELYVYPDADFNAACTSPEGGRVFVLISSAMLEAFDEGELSFVLGHELGHFVYQHHSIPLPLLHEVGELSPRLLLRMHAWLRYAELSADRAGLLCCGTLQDCAAALFKLSSGLHRAPGEQEIAAFIQQSIELYNEAARMSSEEAYGQLDWLSSHPFSPIRLRAAQAFAGSEALTPGGVPLSRVEVEVQELMALMEPGYLLEDSEAAEAMRRLLFAAGVMVAAADGEISDTEREALADLLGHDRVPRQIDPERIAAVMEERIEAVRALVPLPRRAQLIRDLALISRADGAVQPAEKQLICALAGRLAVDPFVVDLALEQQVALD